MENNFVLIIICNVLAVLHYITTPNTLFANYSQESWLPKLRDLVVRINETFSRNFKEMAVAGQVSLGKCPYLIISFEVVYCCINWFIFQMNMTQILINMES